MIRLLLSLLTGVALIHLTACDTTDNARRSGRKPKYGYGGTETMPDPAPPKPPTDTAANDPGSETPGDTAEPTPTPPPPPMKTGSDAAGGTVKATPPYAVPVPNKPGYVTSPRAPYAGYIDVRGYAPGTEIKDPWAPGQTLLVP
jgi:hypothetical protein